MAEKIAIVKIFSTKNNTIVHATDVTGAETICIASGGHFTSGRKKASADAAIRAAEKVCQALKERGFTSIFIFVRGKGRGRSKTPAPAASAAIREIGRQGFNIVAPVVDITPIARGGCREPGGKRGRRV
jgi:small subunit ribosomal protein S11